MHTLIMLLEDLTDDYKFLVVKDEVWKALLTRISDQREFLGFGKTSHEALLRALYQMQTERNSFFYR